MRNLRKLKTKERFVKATIDIIKEHGIEELSARFIAEKTGYNVASIYNYFQNLDYLENLASVYFIKDYTIELTKRTTGMKNALEVYITMWEIFLKHAFDNPYFYYNVFFSAISQDENINLFKDYYEIFKDEKPTQGGLIIGMLEINETHNRGHYVLNYCCKEGSIDCSMLKYLNDIHIGYTDYIITSFVKTKVSVPTKELYNETMRYLIYSMYHFVNKDFLHIADAFLDKYQDSQSRINSINKNS